MSSTPGSLKWQLSPDEIYDQNNHNAEMREEYKEKLTILTKQYGELKAKQMVQLKEDSFGRLQLWERS